MPEIGILHLATWEARDLARRLQSSLFFDYFGETGADNEYVVVVFCATFERDIFFVRMKRYRHGGWKRPWGRGPNDGENFLASERGADGGRISRKWILHPNRGAGVVFVFSFGLGQGGLVKDAPVDRPQSLIDKVVLQKAIKNIENGGFVLRGHGGVGLLPPAEDADALELRALQIEKLLGVFPAFGTNVDRRHLQFFAAQHLVELDVDMQPMAISPR